MPDENDTNTPNTSISNGQAPSDPIFDLSTSRGFPDFLSQQNVSLAITTYQVGKLFLLGVKPDGKVWVFNRNVGRCLGLAVTDNSLWVTSDIQINRFENALEPGQKTPEGFDAVYVPQLAYATGDLDVHDLVIPDDGTPLFVNTLFNCLASVSPTHSFVPLWRPPFISRLAAEDRCHLNGVALVDGKPGFVTAAAESDTFDGWRDQRKSGGIVIDVRTNEILTTGLSMPHSPRWHDDRLWLHNSGTGEFGFLDRDKGVFEPVCFCPGYLRGLSFVGNYAVMGLSKPRHNKTFSGLALDEALSNRRMEPRCGLYVVDLQTGDIAHSVTVEGAVSELYDVGIIHGKNQPVAFGPNSPELKKTVSIGRVAT